MKYMNLNTRIVIKGKITEAIRLLLKREKPHVKDVEGFELIRDLTPSYSAETKRNRLGIYKNKFGKQVIVKKVAYDFESLDALYLRNEAFTLKTLKTIATKNQIFPKFLDFFEEPHQISLVTEYFSAKGLDTFDKKTRSEQALRALSSLNELSQTLKRLDFLALPIRKPFYYLLSFPINVIKLILKNPSKTARYLKFGVLFYRYYSRVAYGDFRLGFVHRDLFPDNILYADKTHSLLIVDWESAIVSDSLYDLAQIAMIYTHEIGDKKMIEVLKGNLESNSEVQRFLGLSIFNSVQMLANTRTNHPVFNQVENFLDTLLTDIMPKILYKKSPFEVVNTITLDLISLFYKITKLPKYNTTKQIVLCYHSVGNTGWRYSVRTNNFKQQLDLLTKHYTVMSLANLLSSKKGGVSITFDDGYRDVVENALPLLEKKRVTATMFVLGNSTKANRVELDNNLPIINYDEITYLSKRGWEIGSHTETHANLGKISDSKLEKEIVESKKEIEKNLKFAINYFAYPKGIYSKKIMAFVKKAGYKAAFTTNGYEIKTNQDKAALSRVSIEEQLTIDQFEAMLSPLGLFISGLFMKILTFKAKFITKD